MRYKCIFKSSRDRKQLIQLKNRCISKTLTFDRNLRKSIFWLNINCQNISNSTSFSAKSFQISVNIVSLNFAHGDNVEFAGSSSGCFHKSHDDSIKAIFGLLKAQWFSFRPDKLQIQAGCINSRVTVYLFVGLQLLLKVGSSLESGEKSDHIGKCLIATGVLFRKLKFSKEEIVFAKT